MGRRALYTARRTEHTRTYTHIHTRQLKTCQLGNAVPVAQPETTIRHVAEQRGGKYCHCVCYFCLCVCVCVLSSCVGWGGFYTEAQVHGLEEKMLGTAKGQNTLAACDLIAVYLHHAVMKPEPAA